MIKHETTLPAPVAEAVLSLLTAETGENIKPVLDDLSINPYDEGRVSITMGLLVSGTPIQFDTRTRGEFRFWGKNQERAEWKTIKVLKVSWILEKVRVLVIKETSYNTDTNEVETTMDFNEFLAYDTQDVVLKRLDEWNKAQEAVLNADAL